MDNSVANNFFKIFTDGVYLNQVVFSQSRITDATEI
jgi:hypothetical protein